MAGGIEVTDLRVAYGSIEVVRGVSLSVAPGQVAALFGPNGAGKTSSLLAISGALPIAGGRVVVNGAEITKARPELVARTSFVHVPERRGLFAQLTVRENIRVATGATDAADRVFELFPALAPLAGRRAGLLSGGEQQMLAVGRALALDPTVLVIDELSLGLAPLVVSEILPQLRAIADRGAAVLLVEQHVPRALEIIDTGYVMSGGRIRLTGTPEQLTDERDLIESAYLGELPDGPITPLRRKAGAVGYGALTP